MINISDNLSLISLQILAHQMQTMAASIQQMIHLFVCHIKEACRCSTNGASSKRQCFQLSYESNLRLYCGEKDVGMPAHIYEKLKDFLNALGLISDFMHAVFPGSMEMFLFTREGELESST